MPLFDFECPNCNLIDEFLIKNENLPNCPKCNTIMYKVYLKPNAVIDPYQLGRFKPDSDFTDMINKIKKR